MSFVTGVITSYNQNKFIFEAIESLVHQVDELIVVDDYSTDGSVKKILQKYGSLNKFLLIQNKTNLGISKSFSKGISSAKGDLILIQGGDDKSLPGRRNLQETVFNEHKEAVLSFSKPLIIDSNGAKADNTYAENSFENVQGLSDYTKKLLLEGNTVCAPSVAFRKRDVEKIGLFKNNFDHAQDYIAWIQLSLLGDFHFSSNPYVEYRIHGNNISRELDENEYLLKFSRNLEIAYGISEFIDNLNDSDLKLLFKKLDFRFDEQLSEKINKLQVKRYLPHKILSIFSVLDCYNISKDEHEKNYQLAREIIKSKESLNNLFF